MKQTKIEQLCESARKIDHVYEVWATAHGLTSCEMQIYYVIMKKEKAVITQKELCMELDAPKTSINSIIKKQLNAGYIEMHPNPENRREKMISLTESGRRFAENLVFPLSRYEEEAAEMLDEKEIEAVVTVQNRFAELLLEKIKTNGRR